MAGRDQPAGEVVACLIAGGEDFVTRRVAELALDFAGIVGDLHAGLTRASTSREPWYPRGTEIRNDRQLTILSQEELDAVAAAMDLPAIDPAWIGGNLVMAGLADLTGLAPGTKLFFDGGATLLVEAPNGPCRTAGASIGRHFPERKGLDLAFPRHAQGRRGLVASVEKPGTIAVGEGFKVRPPAQRAPATGGL